MNYAKKLTSAEEAKKLVKHHKTGLFSHILISGTAEALDNLYVNLVEECRVEKISTTTIQFSKEDPSYCYQYQKSDLLLIKGLELLPAKHNQSFSLRTMLDVGQHRGLKSFIFCEQSAVQKHFEDYSAPFYKFCLRHLVNT